MNIELIDTSEADKFCVMMGNPVEGVTLYGPYDNLADAHHVGASSGDCDWWTIRLHNPKELE